MFQSFVAIGDSFTEGVGDELPDGTVRGWADFVAMGLAATSVDPVYYANLAIRGRKLAPIIDEQLQPALALGAELISFNGGGNDIMRPRVSIESVLSLTEVAVSRSRAAGAHVVLLSGANPCSHLPAGRFLRQRGNALDTAVRDRFLEEEGVTFVDNWADTQLEDVHYWSPDKLHLNARGHMRVAHHVLSALKIPIPTEWRIDQIDGLARASTPQSSIAYYREFVLPWIGRRLTGRSSGDGRMPKQAHLTKVKPTAAPGLAE